eukprot:m.4824 g.4824  ORF g.4824 m.4824 type:complete len:723 (+) comp4011_c0_seq1:176-2344(+)
MAKRFTKAFDNNLLKKKPHMMTSPPARVVSTSGPPAIILTADPPANEEELIVRELQVKNHRLVVLTHSQKAELKQLRDRVEERDEASDLTYKLLLITLRFLSDLCVCMCMYLALVAHSCQLLCLQMEMKGGLIGEGEEKLSDTIPKKIRAMDESCCALLEDKCSQIATKVKREHNSAQTSNEKKLSDAQVAIDNMDRLKKKNGRLQQSLNSNSLKTEKLENEVLRLRDHVGALLEKVKETTQKTEKQSIEIQQQQQTLSRSGSAVVGESSASVDELTATKAKLEERQKQCDALLQENQSLKQQKHLLRTSSTATEELKKQPFVESVLERNTILYKEIAKLREKSMEQEHLLADVSSARVEEAKSFRLKIQQIHSDATNRLKDIENELVELRSERDRLLQQQQSQEQKGNGHSSEKETQALITTLRNQIKQYETLRQQEKQQAEKPPKTAQELLSSSSAEDVVASLLKEIDTLKQSESALMNEIDATGESFDELQDQNDRLVKELKEKEARDLRNLEERVKSSQICANLQEEKRLLQREMEAKHKMREAEHHHYSTLSTSESRLREQFEGAMKKLQSLQTEHEGAKLTLSEEEQKLSDIKATLDQTVKQKDELNKTLQETQKESADSKKALTDALEEKVALTTRVNALSNGSADEVLEAQVDQLSKKLKCSVCLTKEKNTIMLKCFHMFCGDCVQSRLDSRQRKCPQCSQPFGKGDYHRAYLQ